MFWLMLSVFTAFVITGFFVLVVGLSLFHDYQMSEAAFQKNLKAVKVHNSSQ